MEVGTNPQLSNPTNQNSNTGPTELKGNRVVLVCINNVSGTTITHELLYKIFSQFGKVLRILIFDKGQIWKTFVEFSTPEAAVEAKNRVNNLVLFSDGSKITIYPSNLDTIKFQKNNSGGVDYTVLDNLNIYGLKDAPPTGQDPQILPPQRQFEANNYSNLPPQPNLAYKFDPFTDQSQVPFQQGSLTPPNQGELSVPKSNENEAVRVTEILHPKQAQQTEETKKRAENVDKEFEALVADVFQIKPASKAQVTHVHSVPAQLYRDNPLLQQPQPATPDTAVSETSLITPTKYAFPPGSQSLSTGNTPLLHGNPMPGNYDPTKQQQQANFMFNPPMGAPLAQLPQGGSLNNLPLMNAPLHGTLGAQTAQLYQVNQQRPQINRPFLGQQEFPQMGMINPAMVQMNVPFYPDPNARAGVMQPGMEGLDYAHLAGMARPNLQGLSDNVALMFGKGDESKKSKVLYVKGLEHKDIRAPMLHNVFSNFGNILKIIFIPSKSAALVEFENPEYSTICMDYLNNVIFMGKPLRIFYSKYSIINLRNKKGEDAVAEEVFMGNPKTFRFKKNKNISINPPSSTLHLSNLVKEACTEENIRTFFTPYGRIEAIKFIFMENNKNMCLVRMSSIEESLNAIAFLHGKDLDGRKIQISFTRSRI